MNPSAVERARTRRRLLLERRLVLAARRTERRAALPEVPAQQVADERGRR